MSSWFAVALFILAFNRAIRGWTALKPHGEPQIVPSTVVVEPPATVQTSVDVQIVRVDLQAIDLADAEWSGFPWYDDRACWGCDKTCKRRAFRPYAGMNIGAEIRAAGLAHALGDAGDVYHAGFAPRTTGAQSGRPQSCEVSELWEHLCTECGRYVRRVALGLDVAPAGDLAVPVDAADCPF